MLTGLHLPYQAIAGTQFPSDFHCFSHECAAISKCHPWSGEEREKERGKQQRGGKIESKGRRGLIAAVGSTELPLGLEQHCGVRGRAGEEILWHSPAHTLLPAALEGELGLSITRRAPGTGEGTVGSGAAQGCASDTLLAGSQRPNKLFMFPGYLTFIKKAENQLCYSLGYHLPRCLCQFKGAGQNQPLYR